MIAYWSRKANAKGKITMPWPHHGGPQAVSVMRDRVVAVYGGYYP